MLSAEELLLVGKGDWILMKREIIEKVIALFSRLSVELDQVIDDRKNYLPEEVSSNGPKISKGENYRGLPYVVLDYPKCFDGAHIFAVRTLFWWGNFFSITLHLSGNFKERNTEALLKQIDVLRNGEWYICINEDPWQHHYESTNYVETSQLSSEELNGIIKQKKFIKIARKFPLDEWNEMDTLLKDSFSALLNLLQ